MRDNNKVKSKYKFFGVRNLNANEAEVFNANEIIGLTLLMKLKHQMRLGYPFLGPRFRWPNSGWRSGLLLHKVSQHRRNGLQH